MHTIGKASWHLPALLARHLLRLSLEAAAGQDVTQRAGG
jgi:hypothetical protein